MRFRPAEIDDAISIHYGFGDVVFFHMPGMLVFDQHTTGFEFSVLNPF
jgi:hypothetical protein